MGKYIQRNNNSKTNRDMPSNTGVRTRARTLALQKASSARRGGGGGGSYIQLRSRRLVKPTPPKIHKENQNNYYSCKGVASSSFKLNSGNSDGCVKKLVDREDEIRDAEDVGIDDEASFGENMVVQEIEGTERSIRETTPCSFIRDPDTISTPGSSTKRTYSTNSNYRVQIPAPRLIPTTVEMEEFFTEPEKQQQKLFIEKYNFDPVNDKPLPGRYEWLKMDNYVSL